MVQIKSKLEANIFDGVLIKKGMNELTEEQAEIIFNNYTVKDLLQKGYLRVIDLKDIKVREAKKANNPEVKPDFTKMSYNELKAYVGKHNIKTKSMKKDDLLEALLSE